MWKLRNGIKANRLWGLTGRKHARSNVIDRLTVEPVWKGCPRPITTRRVKDNITLYLLAMATATGLAASWGAFDPNKHKLKVMGPENKQVKPAAKKKCVVPPRCPGEEDEPPPPPPKKKPVC